MTGQRPAGRGAGPRRAPSPSAASTRPRPPPSARGGACTSPTTPTEGCGRSRSSNAGGLEAAPDDERVERRRRRSRRGPSSRGPPPGRRGASTGPSSVETKTSPSPGNSVTGAAKKRGTNARGRAAQQREARAGPRRPSRHRDHDRQLRRDLAGRRRRRDDRELGGRGGHDERGLGGERDRVGGGSGRKPRPLSTTRSPDGAAARYDLGHERQAADVEIERLRGRGAGLQRERDLRALGHRHRGDRHARPLGGRLDGGRRDSADLRGELLVLETRAASPARPVPAGPRRARARWRAPFRRTVTVTGLERPPFVCTRTGTLAFAPAGTTTSSTVSLAFVTCAFAVPKSTVLPDASAAKCFPATATVCPASTLSGVIEATSGGVARRKKNHASPVTAARPPSRRGSGRSGSEATRRTSGAWREGRPLPFAEPRAAGLGRGSQGRELGARLGLGRVLDGNRGQLRLVLRPRRLGAGGRGRRGRGRRGGEFLLGLPRWRGRRRRRGRRDRRRGGGGATESGEVQPGGGAGVGWAVGAAGPGRLLDARGQRRHEESVALLLACRRSRRHERRPGDVAVDDDGLGIEPTLGRQVERLRRVVPERRGRRLRVEERHRGLRASAETHPGRPPGRRTSSLALPLAPGGPRQTRSPSCSGCWPSTFSPLTKVPVALPASSIARPWRRRGRARGKARRCPAGSGRPRPCSSRRRPHPRSEGAGRRSRRGGLRSRRGWGRARDPPRGNLPRDRRTRRCLVRRRFNHTVRACQRALTPQRPGASVRVIR